MTKLEPLLYKRQAGMGAAALPLILSTLIWGAVGAGPHKRVIQVSLMALLLHGPDESIDRALA